LKNKIINETKVIVSLYVFLCGGGKVSTSRIRVIICVIPRSAIHKLKDINMKLRCKLMELTKNEDE